MSGCNASPELSRANALLTLRCRMRHWGSFVSWRQHRLSAATFFPHWLHMYLLSPSSRSPSTKPSRLCSIALLLTTVRDSMEKASSRAVVCGHSLASREMIWCTSAPLNVCSMVRCRDWLRETKLEAVVVPMAAAGAAGGAAMETSLVAVAAVAATDDEAAEGMSSI